MDEEKDTSQPQKQAADEANPPIQSPVKPPPTPPKSSDENDQSGDKPNKSSNISDVTMVVATIVIAIGTLVSAAAIVLQWREMVGGGTQTDQIINAANGIKKAQSQLVLDNKQALADNRTALAKVLKENREELAKALQQNRDALQAQTRAANGELTAIQDQTIISERPWLSVEVEPAGDLIFVDGGKEASVRFKFSVKNVGKSIAKGIQIDVKLFPDSPNMPVSLDTIKNQGAICDHPTIHPIGRFDLFPTNKPIDLMMGIGAPESEITAKAIVVPGEKPRSFVGLYLVGCATYFPSFGAEGRQTRFSYHLEGPPITQPDGKLLFFSDGTWVLGGFEVGVRIPQKQLGLRQDLMGGNDAN